MHILKHWLLAVAFAFLLNQTCFSNQDELESQPYTNFNDEDGGSTGGGGAGGGLYTRNQKGLCAIRLFQEDDQRFLENVVVCKLDFNELKCIRQLPIRDIQHTSQNMQFIESRIIDCTN